MAELVFRAERINSNLIFNVFVRPWQMTNPEASQLIDAVSGNGGNALVLSLPWSKTIKDDKAANFVAIFRYRQLLAHGIAIILVPSEDTKTDGSVEDLINWVSTWSRPRDHLYFAFPYWAQPPY
jgi:hypothetical protein